MNKKTAQTRNGGTDRDEEEKKDEGAPPPPLDDKDPSSSPSSSPVRDDSATNNGSSAPMKQQQPSNSSTRRRLAQCWRLVSIAFLVLFHVVLLGLFTGYTSTRLLLQLHQDYWQPQLEAFPWTSERTEQEVTYYHRVCTADDVTTRSVDDLLISNEHMSLDDRVQHMQRHGVSLYPHLLDPAVAAPLRDWILQQNLRERGYYVIENDFRYSFGIRVDQDATVTAALQQLLDYKRNPQLIESLEAIVGPNPAVIEFTAITSQAGATTQRVHQDVVPEGSAAKYGRSFVPSYSLFVPLQNTTAQMGATQICPGSHMCADCLEVCETEGFAVSGETGAWPTGFGALVNQQTAHRGMAHADFDGPDRVLFILTFAPRPQWYSTVETRQLSQGGSYSMHWMQWGHALRDFAQPATKMRQPWRLLRSLGLYKPANADWGWDFPSTALMRLTNEEAQYSRGDLDEFVEELGGIPVIPKSLQADIREDVEDGTAWVYLVVDTIQKCGAAFKVAHWSSLAAFLVGMVLILAVQWKRGAMTGRALGKCTFRNLIRLALLHGMIVLAGRLFLYQVSHTPWARQIRKGQLYHVPRGGAEDLSGTLPLDQDVLRFDEDYQSEYLASFTRVLEVSHPGNAAWNSLISQYATGFLDWPLTIQSVLCSQLLEWTRSEQRRILAKNQKGEWAVLPPEAAARLGRTSLIKASNPWAGALLTRIGHLMAETKFGIWRDSALHRQQWSIPGLLDELQEKILSAASGSDPPSEIRRPALLQKGLSGANRKPLRTLPKLFRPSLPERPLSLLVSYNNRTAFPPRQSNEVEEPYLGAWLQVGDVVEAKYGIFNEWYRAVVQSASADRVQWEVMYDDGEVASDVCRQCVRPYLPYSIGEEVDWRSKDDVYTPGRIVAVHVVDSESEEKYDVGLEETKKLVKDVTPRDLRRAVSYDDAEELDPGTRVIAMFQGIPEELYAGTIQRQNGDGTYVIHYDDGDVEYEVPLEYITIE